MATRGGDPYCSTASSQRDERGLRARRVGDRAPEERSRCAKKSLRPKNPPVIRWTSRTPRRRPPRSPRSSRPSRPRRSPTSRASCAPTATSWPKCSSARSCTRTRRSCCPPPSVRRGPDPAPPPPRSDTVHRPSLRRERTVGDVRAAARRRGDLPGGAAREGGAARGGGEEVRRVARLGGARAAAAARGARPRARALPSLALTPSPHTPHSSTSSSRGGCSRWSSRSSRA